MAWSEFLNEPLSNIVFAVFAVFFLLYKNQERHFIFPVASCVFLVLTSVAFVPYMSWLFFLLWTASGVGLTIFYTFRFLKRGTKSSFDVVRWLGVILLITYPASYIYINDSFTSTQQVLNVLILPVLGFIKLYDIYVFSPQIMKKKFVIILIFQTVLIILLLIFANVKKIEADRQRNETYNLEEKARQLEIELNKFKELNKDSTNPK